MWSVLHPSITEEMIVWWRPSLNYIGIDQCNGQKERGIVAYVRLCLCSYEMLAQPTLPVCPSLRALRSLHRTLSVHQCPVQTPSCSQALQGVGQIILPPKINLSSGALRGVLSLLSKGFYNSLLPAHLQGMHPMTPGNAGSHRPR